MGKGKILSLISGSNGKPRFVITKRDSSCSKCGHTIPCNRKCAEIPKVGGAYTNWKRYCPTCFQAVIEQTQADINELKSSMAELSAAIPAYKPKQEELLPELKV